MHSIKGADTGEAQMNLLISKQAAIAFGLESRRMVVANIQDASKMWAEYRDLSGMGVSEIGNGGNVLDDNGKRIAKISYNGRIWE